MSKGKSSKPGPSQSTGLYKADSIKDVAESLGITNLADNVASALASDVEYRIHQVVEEASRFMRHARRTTLTTSDIDQALRVLNIEPLYGHTPHNPPSFRRALPFPTLPTAGPVYFIEDEEIDFDRVLKEERLSTGNGTVRWTAHWLAVEGIQPLIPENPPAIPKDDAAGGAQKNGVNGIVAGMGPLTPASPGARRLAASQHQQQQQQQLVKQVLSRELQLYHARLTSSLLSSSSSAADQTKRTAALASLRHDAGLQPLLPYLVRWVGEGVIGILKEGADNGDDDSTGKVLEVYLQVIAALLDNQTLFVEPYLHQLLPPVLSALLYSSLPPPPSPTSPNPIRTLASQTLSHLLTQHSATYHNLSSRIMKTLLLGLVGQNKAKGTREGAVMGLVAVGKEAVRQGLIEAGGAKVIGNELEASMKTGRVRDVIGSEGLREEVLRALRMMCGFEGEGAGMDRMMIGLEEGNEEDKGLGRRLREALGDYFADRVRGDKEWVKAILGADA